MTLRPVLMPEGNIGQSLVFFGMIIKNLVEYNPCYKEDLLLKVNSSVI